MNEGKKQQIFSPCQGNRAAAGDASDFLRSAVFISAVGPVELPLNLQGPEPVFSLREGHCKGSSSKLGLLQLIAVREDLVCIEGLPAVAEGDEKRLVRGIRDRIVIGIDDHSDRYMIDIGGGGGPGGPM